jgi:class 3 adenylate cyclase
VTELPAGTLTFVFSDVEGSTRLLRQLGERYAPVVADHQRLMREAFRHSRGWAIA